MLTKAALQELERIVREDPERPVIWCADCGHIATGGKQGRRIQDGDDHCGRTLSTGAASECIKEMMQ